MRVLVVSDIHGNIEALRAVAAAEPDVDHVLCLGDLVDYGPAPDEVVTWVRAQSDATVRGNHDNAVAFGEDCRSAPMFRRLSVETRKRTVPLLGPRTLEFLRSLPTRRSVHVDGIVLELVHAAPGDPLFQYLPATRVEEWRDAVAGIDADLILVGHTWSCHLAVRCCNSVKAHGSAVFLSILWRPEADALERRHAPAYLADLNVDQVVYTITAGRDAYHLAPISANGARDFKAGSARTGRASRC